MGTAADSSAYAMPLVFFLSLLVRDRCGPLPWVDSGLAVSGSWLLGLWWRWQEVGLLRLEQGFPLLSGLRWCWVCAWPYACLVCRAGRIAPGTI